jgi:ACR3 family arsenite efflux pump ArsB
MVHFVVIVMLCSMLYAITINEESEYTPNISHNFAVWLVKFPCAVALHFMLYPEVANGMAVMKFSNN